MCGPTTTKRYQDSMPMVTSTMKYTRREYKNKQHGDERNKEMRILEEAQEENSKSPGLLEGVATHTRTS